MKLGNQDFAARVDARHTFSPGDQIKLAFDMNKAHFFDSPNRTTHSLKNNFHTKKPSTYIEGGFHYYTRASTV